MFMVAGKLFSRIFLGPYLSEAEAVIICNLLYKSSLIVLSEKLKSEKLVKEEPAIGQGKQILPEKMVGNTYFCDCHDGCDDWQSRIHIAVRVLSERKTGRQSR